ncbi:MAG TPA: RsmE family RNA methyltransferase [Candidatus Hydrogenedentes bacterium]|nr:RsmE family RNA methyltransferase [Candidatus Hydrogenedentota bacterium]HNT89629.1 RsmE family RNA methyltransferase [Candidatus Hydrogenedentota bacterium]
MPHLHRFYVPADTPGAGEVALPPEEARHALKVLRLRVGDRVALLDGQGRELVGAVARMDRRDVVVAVEEERRAPRPAPAVTLAQAWLHQDKAVELLVRIGTELGVDRFLFFRADRSERAPRVNPKWDRIGVEACKQCGRLWLPEFVVAPSLAEVLRDASGDLIVAAIEGPPVPLARALSGAEVTLLIGPEGDFTPEEIRAALERGARPISLGTTTFRAETAAIVAATLVQHHLGRLGPLHL